jgi:hypothetical protein
MVASFERLTKKGEVIAGKSVVAFRREETDETPSAKCFGFVQTYDEKPRRRLWELLKSQGMQENQQVVFLSDGSDTVRQLQEYLHPCSEHLIDWFHSAPAASEGVASRTASVRPGNIKAARKRETLALARQLRRGTRTHRRPKYRTRSPSSVLTRSGQTRQEPWRVQNYIRNNTDFIPNFGERYRQGETISTAFVESTINQVVSKRFVKKQQMQ